MIAAVFSFSFRDLAIFLETLPESLYTDSLRMGNHNGIGKWNYLVIILRVAGVQSSRTCRVDYKHSFIRTRPSIALTVTGGHMFKKEDSKKESQSHRGSMKSKISLFKSRYPPIDSDTSWAEATVVFEPVEAGSNTAPSRAISPW